LSKQLLRYGLEGDGINDAKGTKAHYDGVECLIVLKEGSRPRMLFGICDTVSGFDAVKDRKAIRALTRVTPRIIPARGGILRPLP
jgi:hypothetical protein